MSATGTLAENWRRPHMLASWSNVAVGSLWNAAGRGLPIFVALGITPWLVARLGIDRWGLFTLALSFVGVAGILDFGISRALTRSLSEAIVAGRTEEEAPLVTTALWVLTIVSTIGGILGTAAMPWLVDHWLHVPLSLRQQAIDAFRLLTISAPLIVINVGLTGVVAAYQRYKALNLIVIPVSIAYFVLPALTLLVWDSLPGVMLSLIFCRLMYTLSCAGICFRLVPGLWRLPRLETRFLRPLLHVGGWIALSDTLTPLLLNADRFLIGALLPLAAVSYYATPFDVVARFTLVPIAVTGALFPAISAAAQAVPEQVEALLRKGAAIVIVVTFLPCILSVGFAADLLKLWLGSDFAAHSYLILQLLAAGMFFACVALVLDTLFQGTGRADVPAKLMVAVALVSVPLAAAALWYWGIVGAAVVFFVRTAIACGARAVLAHECCPGSKKVVMRVMTVLITGGCLLLAAMVPASFIVRAAVVLAGTTIFYALVLLFMMNRNDRAQILTFARGRVAVGNASIGLEG